MNNKELIIHLIREELRNKLLMYSLRNLGFDCTSYTLSICEEILTLAGFTEKPDNLYQWYFKLIDNALEEITFWNLDEMMEKWSLSIYIELLEARLNGTVPNLALFKTE
jgi:hypothetical protein